MTSLLRIGVLASHEGTTLQAILDACASGEISARVVVVVSNNSDSGALAPGARGGLGSRALSSKTHPGRGAGGVDAAIIEALTAHEVDVVMLAGYMKKLEPGLLERYRGRILNTHPALLPKFGRSRHVRHARARSGAARGRNRVRPQRALGRRRIRHRRVLAQAQVPVEDGDTPETLARARAAV